MVGRSVSFLGMLITAVALASVGPSSVALGRGQSTSRTPWGEPDLQGIWAVQSQTPLERPDEYAGREYLTDEEVVELDRTKAQDEGRNARGEPGTERDVGGAYNAVFNSILRTGRRTSLIVDPSDGQVPPFTAEVQVRLEKERAYRNAPATAPNPGTYNLGNLDRIPEGPEDRRRITRCLGSTLPDLGQGSFGDGTIRIVQSPGQVAIYHEHNHGGGASRIIRVDGRPHPSSHMRFYLGDSRGQWDGDTLVVNTTNFTRKSEFRGSRENLHLIERYRRVDGATLEREITLDDLTTWTRPWTVRIELGKTDDKSNLIFESACHEGNFGLTGILAGARADDAKVATRPPE